MRTLFYTTITCLVKAIIYILYMHKTMFKLVLHFYTNNKHNIISK